MKFEQMNDAKVSIQENQIIMTARQGTNLFNGVSGTWKMSTFPYYYTKVSNDFLVRCKVAVDFKTVYDLGSLIIFENEDKWIKFAFEYSDMGTPAIVSIVTNETSDDCNGAPIEKKEVWLQICRQGDVFALHYSLDKENWKLARIARLHMQNEIMVGISTQCPSGDYCTAYFSEFELMDNPYQDIRKLIK